MNTVKKRTYLATSLGLLAFMTMFHSDTVGLDTSMYINHFTAIANADSLLAALKSTSFEPGFVVYNRVLSLVSTNPRILFISNGIVVYTSLGIFLSRYTEAPGLAVYSIVTLMLFDMYLSAARQAMALAIILFAVPYIERRSPIPFLLVTLLATAFHYTSVAFVAAYPLCCMVGEGTRRGTIWILVLIIVYACVVLGFDQFMSLALTLMPKYQYYRGSRVFVRGESSLAIILKVLMFAFLYVVARLSHRRTEHDHFRLSCRKLAFANIAICIMSMNAAVLTRLGLYYSLFSVIDFSEEVCQISSQDRIVYSLLCMLILLAHGLVIVWFRMPQWYTTYPFSFCF